MPDPTERAAQAFVDGLSNARVNQIVLTDRVIEEADNNATVQRNLFLFVVQYIYDRQAMYERGLAYTDDMKFIGRRATQWVQAKQEGD